MKLGWLKVFLLAFILIMNTSCGGGESESEDLNGYVASDENKITKLEFVYKNSVFTTSIDKNEIVLDRALPYGLEEVSIKTITFSSKATSNKKVGDILQIQHHQNEIEITAENGSKSTYYISLKTLDYASIVAKHGRLQVNGNKIVDKNSEHVSFAGNSFFWSNDGWGGNRFYNKSAVSWLKLDWQTTIIRAAIGVDESGGYIDSKINNLNRAKTLINAALEEGLYVIIDWHSHHAEDYPEVAIEFFSEMAQLYGEYDNVIYEIYNEPLDISWSNELKPYAEKVIKAIREFDSDNLILVGTPTWSQDVDVAAKDPITTDSNLAYVLHFYTIYHQQWLRDRASEALNSGIALFVTEWGSIGYTQNDSEAEKWMQWCRDHKISHLSWAVNDKEEEWSIVKSGSNTGGNWSEDRLTESGKLSRDIIRNW
jgi:ribosomal 50S subunit-recycling heat shock protein